jgi:YHS domain-containing protein
MKEAGVTPESINKPQTLCPVMGNPIDKKIFVDHLGQRIYFCCAGCPPMFKKEPQKFLDKLKKAGVTPESINKPQTLCPVMGNPIDKKIFVDHLGQRIYFCCAGCPPIFKKAPDKYLDQMKEAGIVVEVLEKAEVDHSQHNH